MKEQIKICNLLLQEKIINSRIENKIYTIINPKELKRYYKSLLFTKEILHELNKLSNQLNLNFDINSHIKNIDQIHTKDLRKEIMSKLPFDKKRNKHIFNLAKNNFPKDYLTMLINSSSITEFDKKIEEIPYSILVKCNIKRPKDYFDYTKNSIKSITIPMGGKV